MNHWMRRFSQLYKFALQLYPRRFRAEFGEEMQSVFNAALADAAQYGLSALGRLCLRELSELPINILREHFTTKGNFSMQHPPLAWRKVALALIPGLFALTMELLQRNLGLDSTASYVGLTPLCFVLCAIGFVRERRLAVWSFPALGILLALGMTSMANLAEGSGPTGRLLMLGLYSSGPAFAVRWLARQKGVGFVLLGLGALGMLLIFGVFSLVILTNVGLIGIILMACLYSIVPLVLAGWLARQTGVLAGLVFVGAAFVMWDGIGDPAYALGIYTDNLALVKFVSICPQVFFLLITPILVMRLSSTRARILGYLVPLSVGLVITTAISAALRPYDLFAFAISRDFMFYLLPLLIILVVCVWVGRHKPAGQQSAHT